jgi:hypothetical protein
MYLRFQTLERVQRRDQLVVLGHVVMPEHVHLWLSGPLWLSEPQRETLPAVLQALKLGFVRSADGLPSELGGDFAPSLAKNDESWGTRLP